MLAAYGRRGPGGGGGQILRFEDLEKMVLTDDNYKWAFDFVTVQVESSVNFSCQVTYKR